MIRNLFVSLLANLNNTKVIPISHSFVGCVLRTDSYG